MINKLKALLNKLTKVNEDIVPIMAQYPNPVISGEKVELKSSVEKDKELIKEKELN